jgi:hypothetical protein
LLQHGAINKVNKAGLSGASEKFRKKRLGESSPILTRRSDSNPCAPTRRRERSPIFTTEMPSQLLNFTHCYWHGCRGSWKIRISPSSLGGLVSVAHRRGSFFPTISGLVAVSTSFAEHSKRMFHPKHIAAVLIAMCQPLSVL